MRGLKHLFFLSSALGIIAAADGSRPRGVGPECKKASPSTAIDHREEFS